MLLISRTTSYLSWSVAPGVGKPATGVFRSSVNPGSFLTACRVVRRAGRCRGRDRPPNPHGPFPGSSQPRKMPWPSAIQGEKRQNTERRTWQQRQRRALGAWFAHCNKRSHARWQAFAGDQQADGRRSIMSCDEHEISFSSYVPPALLPVSRSTARPGFRRRTVHASRRADAMGKEVLVIKDSKDAQTFNAEDQDVTVNGSREQGHDQRDLPCVDRERRPKISIKLESVATITASGNEQRDTL